MLSLMLSVTYKPLLLSAIMLSVVTPFEVPLIGEHFTVLFLSVKFLQKKFAKNINFPQTQIKYF
jgi:hypothetical protein